METASYGNEILRKYSSESIKDGTTNVDSKR
jgi:hypothetical protein